MPKGTVEIKKGDRRVRVRKQTKFKLGGRKSTVGARDISTEALVAKFENARPRDKQTIRNELDNRGVDLAA